MFSCCFLQFHNSNLFTRYARVNLVFIAANLHQLISFVVLGQARGNLFSITYFKEACQHFFKILLKKFELVYRRAP